MIIVSQDKDRIFNFDNLTNILATKAGKDNEWCIKVIFLNLDFEVIAYYATEERAKEVLREITIAYANITMLSMPNIDIHEFIPEKEMVRNIAYEMPEE